MAKNLMQKLRKNRIAVPVKFRETVKENGRETTRTVVYPVYMTPSQAHQYNTSF